MTVAMARPLRVERAGGRFHATARGNARRHIYRDDSNRFHFLELLSEMPARFGVRLHAYGIIGQPGSVRRRRR
jgi:putative transposase